jgi:formamidopyrimidine-DNA glycosylase
VPELPEVETVRRRLASVITDRTLAHVRQNRPDLRRPFPVSFARRLQGRAVTAVGRRGKYLLFTLDTGLVWLVHLGMSGGFTCAVAYEPRTHDHLVITLDNGLTLAYHDPRRFGMMDLVALSGGPLAGLGVEPLDPSFDGAALGCLLSGKSQTVKTALLDQRLVAGIGNIYANESLFQAKIHPERPARSLDAMETSALARAIRSVLEQAIAANGSTLKDYRQPDGDTGSFQNCFAVYGRAGQPCVRCTAPITAIRQSGRSTFLCPRCQPVAR